jgi:hypothetical protein
MARDSIKLGGGRRLRDGESCTHSGCLQHRSHPCEVCGRVNGAKPRGKYSGKQEHDMRGFEPK